MDKKYEFWEYDIEGNQKFTYCEKFKVLDIDEKGTLKVLYLEDNKLYYIKEEYLCTTSEFWQIGTTNKVYIIREIPDINQTEIDFLVGCIQTKENLNNN